MTWPQVAHSELADERSANEEATARASKAERELDQARARAAVLDNKFAVGFWAVSLFSLSVGVQVRALFSVCLSPLFVHVVFCFSRDPFSALKVDNCWCFFSCKTIVIFDIRHTSPALFVVFCGFPLYLDSFVSLTNKYLFSFSVGRVCLVVVNTAWFSGTCLREH